MDPKVLRDARELSKDAFRQATERFLERKRRFSLPEWCIHCKKRHDTTVCPELEAV